MAQTMSHIASEEQQRDTYSTVAWAAWKRRRRNSGHARRQTLAITLQPAAIRLSSCPCSAKKAAPIEDRAKTIEAGQPWLKLGMSRRTWYRPHRTA
jgi:hypothetical protein